jgi:hypothetical protein
LDDGRRPEPERHRRHGPDLERRRRGRAKEAWPPYQSHFHGEGTIERALSRGSLGMAKTLDLDAVLAEITNGLTNDLGAALARIH